MLSGNWPYYAGHKVPESQQSQSAAKTNRSHAHHGGKAFPSPSSNFSPSGKNTHKSYAEDDCDETSNQTFSHPDEYLSARLREIPERSLLLQDLKFLSQGLEGRSRNPISLLFDALSHPGADMGHELPSLLKWRYHSGRRVDHVVLGKGPPGGSWHSMNSSILTISLGSWMELPGLDFRTWELETRSSSGGMSPTGPRDAARASAASVAMYYQDYVRRMNLENNFRCDTVVTSARPIPYSSGCCACYSVVAEGGENVCPPEKYWKPLTEEEQDWWNSPADNEDRIERCPETGVQEVPRPTLWRVSGYQIEEKVDENGEVQRVYHEFTYITPHLVLGTGCADLPNRLGIPGETLPFVTHSLRDLEQALDSLKQEAEDTNLEGRSLEDPVLIVGAGLSAADAVLGVRFNGLPVLHAFRRSLGPNSSPSSGILLKQLPGHLYPEYHKVWQMMSDGRTGASYRGYQALCGGKLLEIHPDRKVCLAFDHNDNADELEVHRVSIVAVLIGAKPNLNFLPHGGRHLAAESSSVPVSVDPYTHQCRSAPGLYALGPLAGDNFVRFLQGGALAIASHLQNELKRNKHILHKTLTSGSDHS
ncbi:hypothetical protein J437_LFUL019413 [Ladona fulva]|nr:hypothetical protein J437_LFUL019413 [Ladona fulva]